MKRAGGAVKRKSGAGPNGSAPLQTADDKRDANPFTGTRISRIGTGRESERIRVPFLRSAKIRVP